jgi:hypothetical protein
MCSLVTVIQKHTKLEILLTSIHVQTDQSITHTRHNIPISSYQSSFFTLMLTQFYCSVYHNFTLVLTSKLQSICHHSIFNHNVPSNMTFQKNNQISVSALSASLMQLQFYQKETKISFCSLSNFNKFIILQPDLSLLSTPNYL